MKFTIEYLDIRKMNIVQKEINSIEKLKKYIETFLFSTTAFRVFNEEGNCVLSTFDNSKSCT